MQEEAVVLEEVVAVAYGTQKFLFLELFRHRRRRSG